ncbi:MAG TPA: DUF2846 domain-containing protein [Terriglobales bacterium]|nr:DUF2846 domain-containing protein [Terriglobales bacterium]
MRRSTFLLLLLGISQTFARAQSTSASTPQDSSRATVYIYRYKQFVGSGLAPSVYCDDVQLARMENGRYFTTTVDAGKHIFRSNDEQSGIVLQAVAGGQYFIRVDIATGFMKGHGRLSLLDSQQGMYELTSDKLRPLDAAKVVDKDRVSIEVAHPRAQTQMTQPAPALTTAPVPPSTTSNPAPVAAQAHSQSAQSPTQLMSVSTSGVTPTSSSGDQVSLGDAARLARQKKQAQQK